ncbi:hypothetical protein ABZ671_21280 [Micromonospora sp. NPDC006766]|uniref:hypothetical protein n=1 Tax=Micromonospora sp. NPDC006766 TaxID=3154778 RepID=UPI0033CCB051
MPSTSELCRQHDVSAIVKRQAILVPQTRGWVQDRGPAPTVRRATGVPAAGESG